MRYLVTTLLLVTACSRPPQPGAPFTRAELTPATFPLAYSADSRTLVDAAGTPFPILGRAGWAIASLSAADYQSFLDDTAAKGFDAVECFVPAHHQSTHNPPFDVAGDAPFLQRLDGQPWTGTLAYGNAAAEAPDFTTPNPAYWAVVDGIVSYAASKGIAVLMFPAYAGYGGGDQGWMVEVQANGQARMQQYGAWVAQRYAGSTNIVWMLGGDMGTFSAAQQAAEQGLDDGLHTGPTRFYSAEWDSGMIGKDQAAFASSITLDSVYSFEGHVSDNAARAYAHSPALPAFLLEEPYDQEGPDGTGINSAANQPVRRYEWWGWLGAVGGYVAGNGYVWPFQPGVWQQHLNTQNTLDLQRLNAFVRSFQWWNLRPSGALVTAGQGTIGDISYVSAASTPDKSLLIAYVPPAHASPFSLDMTALTGLARARWFNPTTAAYTDASGGYTLATTGSHQFAPPGDNGSGYSDWALVLDAQPQGCGQAGTSGAGAGGTAGVVAGAGGTTATGGSGGTGGQQVATSVQVSPPSASVAPGGTQQFAATELDQAGQPMAQQPAFAWSVSGGGSVSGTGLFTAGSSAGGPFTVTAKDGALAGTASVTVAAQMIRMGETSVLTTDDNGNSNLLIGQKTTLGQQATLQSLSFYASQAAGRLRLGLYADSSGSPGALVTACPEITPAVGWNTCGVAATSLPAGTYWLAYLPSSDALHFPKGGTSPASKYRTFAYAAMPGTFGSSGLQTTGSHWSFYATLTVP